MTTSTLKKKILEKLDLLPTEKQWRILDYTRTLTDTKTAGIPGRDLLRFAGTIEKSDLESMKLAIDDGCEGIDSSEW